MNLVLENSVYSRMKSLKTKRYRQEFTGKVNDLEKALVKHLSLTGKKELIRRKKAGYSVYYLEDGHIVERKPDDSVIIIKRKAGSRWVRLEQTKRIVFLK